jgi:pyridoxal biosynthesis lyase PdxS
MRYEIYESTELFVRLDGVKVGSEWFKVSQEQKVGDHWTSAGCHWYTEDEIKRILENRGEMIEEGEGEIEHIDGWYCVLVGKDTEGRERFL